MSRSDAIIDFVIFNRSRLRFRKRTLDRVIEEREMTENLEIEYLSLFFSFLILENYHAYILITIGPGIIHLGSHSYYIVMS